MSDVMYCEECFKATGVQHDYGADGFCPNCGGAKPSATTTKVETLSTLSGRSGRSGKTGTSHLAGLTMRSRVTARPYTIVATAKAVLAGVPGGAIRKRSEVSARSTSKRRNAAAGLFDVTPLPPVPANDVVRPGLSIPAEQRVCYNPDCSGHVRDANGNVTTPYNLYRKKGDGTPLDKGKCNKCHSPFDFSPIPTDTEIGQYKVLGPMAVGGCGFIYGAFDLWVGRNVVLKGLLNSRDPEAQANAVTERKFLAELSDPHIVNILNFVTYENEGTGDTQTFIVMEYIDGHMLKTLLKQHMKDNNNERMPLTEAIYYILGILPAFSYLHKKGVLYCDFKPDNAMVQGDRMRLIDVGGARKKDDTESPYYATRGYAAPEAVNQQVVSVSSDLYTIIRTLAVLTLDFKWREGEEHEFSLPEPDQEPLFRKYECFYRLLIRGHEDPDQRWQSADELGDQLLGVLNEIVAIDTQEQKPAVSSFFAADVLRDPGKPTFLSIPDLKIDQEDPARSLIEAALASSDAQEQRSLYEQAIQQFPKSSEAPLRLAQALTDIGSYDEAQKLIDDCIVHDPFDFRNYWMRGRLFVARGQHEEAFKHFDAVYSELPGELAPKLALGIAAELKGDIDTAIRYYKLVAGVDRNFVTAAFGLARTVKQQDPVAAAEAYELVPASSISYVPALTAKVRTLLSGTIDVDGLNSISQTMARIPGDTLETHKLRADVFAAAIAQCATLKAPDGSKLLGIDLHERALRLAAEAELRACARYAERDDDKIRFVNDANRIRPVTNY